MSFIRRELPIKITFGRSKQPRYQQHIKRVHVEGPEDSLPEQIILDADEIADGGVLTIDDVAWPEDCEVVDRRGIDPVITVQRAKNNKRGGKRMDDDYDD